MKKLFIITALAVSVAVLNAQETAGFQLALTPGIALHASDTVIHGASFDIWGENPQHAFNLGFFNGSTGESSGFSWAIFANYSDTYTGVAWGFVNISHKKFVGWQDGFVNCSLGYFRGLQSGFINIAMETHGVQFGLVNNTQSLDGVQIGIANVVLDNPWFTRFPNKLATGFPLVNWSF